VSQPNNQVNVLRLRKWPVGGCYDWASCFCCWLAKSSRQCICCM